MTDELLESAEPTEPTEASQSLTPVDGMRWYVVHAYSGMEKPLNATY